MIFIILNFYCNSISPYIFIIPPLCFLAIPLYNLFFVKKHPSFIDISAYADYRHPEGDRSTNTGGYEICEASLLSETLVSLSGGGGDPHRISRRESKSSHRLGRIGSCYDP